MKIKLLPSLLACSAVLAFGQTNRPDYSHVRITAEHQENDGALIRCRGHVEIATETMLLRADEADFHSDTGEVELRGNVQMKLLAGPPNTKQRQVPSTDTSVPLRGAKRFWRQPYTLPEIWKQE